MTSFNSIIKQLQINRFDLTSDVLNEIKSFCFYDIKSWEVMNFIKHKKNRIHNLFENFTISRVFPYDMYPPNLEDIDEHWVFYMFNEDEGPNPKFQGMNCRLCGNYKITNTNNCSNKIMCVCPDNVFNDIPDLIEVLGNEENLNNWFLMNG